MAFRQRINTFAKNWQDKGFGLEVVNSEEVTRKIRAYQRFACRVHWCHIYANTNLFPELRVCNFPSGEKRECFLCLLFLNCLQFQNNFHVKEAYFGVTYPGFLCSLVNYLLVFTDLFSHWKRQSFVSVLRILFTLVRITVFVSSVGNP